MNKKVVFFALLFVFTLFACNRKAFLNKLIGTWSTGSYKVASVNMTKSYTDTTHVKFQLTINDNQQFKETWFTYTYTQDSLYIVDTLGYDSVSSTYNIFRDTLRFVDTTIVPHISTGRWDLLNSEQDLQLTRDSDMHNPIEYQILNLDKGHLNLLTGNQELDLIK